MWKKFRWDMFITSFLPLWVSIIIIDIWNAAKKLVDLWNANNTPCQNVFYGLNASLIEILSIVVILIGIAISILGINSFLRERNCAQNNSKVKIIKATRANKLSAEFLLAYILPMIAFDFSNLQNIVLFLVYFSVLAFLCIRNNNIYTNIFLEFKGYKMYYCDVSSPIINTDHIYRECLVISKKNLCQEEENNITCWDFDNYIYIIIDEESR